MHASDISNVRRTDLAVKVAGIMPGHLRDNVATYFTQGGSGAVETAIKFVRKITGRTQIAAFHGAYHGVWCGGNSLTTGDQYRDGYGPFMPGVVHLPYPYCYRCCFGFVITSYSIHYTKLYECRFVRGKLPGCALQRGSPVHKREPVRH